MLGLRHWSLALLMGLQLSWVSAFAQPSTETTRVAVAANLRMAVDQLYPAFQARHPSARIDFVFGSTGNFTRQILQGAPFALLVAADERSVEVIAQAQQKAGRSTRAAAYAQGQLSLVYLKRLGLPSTASAAQIIRAARRTAIANPQTAPYGRAAQQWLGHTGLSLSPQQMAIGENIGQAAQFLLTGSVEAALLARSLTSHPTIQDCCLVLHLPTDGMDPIRQAMILLQPTNPTAVAFFDFLMSSQATTILQSFGYQRP
jgi:molybdate transport system substrate-binding protein